MLPVSPFSPRRSLGALHRASLAAGVVLMLTGCQRVGVTPTPAPVSIPACAVPNLDRSGWTVQQDSTGPRYRVPPGFTERIATDPPSHEFTYEGEPSGRILVGMSPSAEHYRTLRRAPSPGMHEMSECADEVGGRPILLQAWRTEGGIVRAGRRLDRFDVLALVSLEPMRTLYVTGGGDSPDFQEVVLTVARSVEVESR